MGELNLKVRLLSRLNSLPGVYPFMRKSWRWGGNALVELLRAVGIGPRVGAARGFIGALQQVQDGECDGRVMLETQQLPLLPEVSLIARAGMNQNGRQPWPIFWMRRAEARLVGRSLATLDKNKLLIIEGVFGNELCRMDPSFNYTILPKATRLDGPWTSLISRWSEGFYHWFSDALPRLALLGEMPQETKILVRGPLKDYQRESLQMLGLLHRVRETSENHLLIEDYYFTSPVGMTGCTNPYAVGWLKEKFLPHRTNIETPRKFFIKRHGKTRGINNQVELSSFFEAQGWAVVDLEELSFSQQISWFYNAEAIVGEHGAGFTNLIWCRPGCRVLELCADNFLNGCYEGIALCLGLYHEFRIFPGGPLSSISVNLHEIERWMRSNHLSHPAGTRFL